jgi:type I restriction enzyme S subunit
MRQVLVKNEEFKDSPVGKIPKDWEVKTLRELSVGGISNGFFKKPELVGSGYPLVNVFDLYQDFGIDLSLVERVNTSEKEQSKYAIQPGDCFFTRSSLVLSGIAHCNIILNLPEAALFECHLMRVRPDKSQVIPEFLALWCRSSWARKFLMSRAKQVTMTTISQPDIAPLPIPLPPKEEQRHIAEILDTVDEAIARTSSLIIKLKQTKAGLLQDLLTRGLDEDGKLRDPQAHPEQFKDSALGQIPKDWDVSPLNQEIGIVHGYAFKGEYFADSPPGEVLLVPGNFHREGGLYFDDNNTKFYRGAIPENTVLNNGELLIVMTDLSPRTLILGRVVQLELPFTVLHNQRIGKIVTKLPDTWDKCFLMLVMNSDTIRRNIISNATGTTVRHTSPDRIIANFVPKPNIQEQSKIVQILNTSNNRIRQEQAYLNKLKLQKQGLMQDLLIGKMRVKNL